VGDKETSVRIRPLTAMLRIAGSSLAAQFPSPCLLLSSSLPLFPNRASALCSGAGITKALGLVCQESFTRVINAP
jgi:hypothetical protein